MNTPPIRTVHLHGSLAQFGKSFDLAVRDPAEACRALAVQIPGFRDELKEGSWHVFRGPLDAENDLSRDDVHMGLGKAREIHIMPVAQGAGGAFKAVLGLLLLGPQNAIAAFTTPLDSITSMLSPTPQTDSYSERERPGERPSFLFDGPTNTSTQGLPVPLIYGCMRVGSIVVSADLSADDIALGSDGDPDDPVAIS